MKALSIRQPWAAMILHCGKDIENRTWPTKVRGRVLIHASKTITRTDYRGALDQAHHICGVPVKFLNQYCSFEALKFGGIIGSVEIVDCVEKSTSPWHAPGQWGFVLRDPQPLPFVIRGGMLRFFDIMI